ncbi:MAG: Ldh family oxidoreductase [Candidatus Hodarchaeales archaeon]|jgi:LDH2 family malate/lactate/ureidoglycolate dehydrogenase
MSNEAVHLDVATLENFMKDVFIGLGAPEDDASIIADVLIASDLRGIESHGVQRLKMYYDRILQNVQTATTEITIVKETPTTARLDAGHGMGHVAAYRAMELAIKKAKEFGTGAVSVGNSTHFGIAGYFSQMAIDTDMIGISVTNARPSIAPTFGIENMMGTNPLTIGIPTDEDFPFLIDCATSITQRGKIEVLARTKTPVPAGWVIDDQGELATDSVAALEALTKGTAALLPLGGVGEILGGHKGYGYAAAVEILSAALWGGPFMKDLTLDKGYQLGHFFLAIDVEGFIEPTIFKKIAGNICRVLRNSQKAPGQDRIYTAGEKEYEMEQKRRQEGIPLNKSIQQDLLTMQKELGLTGYSFPF